ncbi:hypothetical protein ACQP25_42480 [Microtetraspora malaysiensis]
MAVPGGAAARARHRRGGRRGAAIAAEPTALGAAAFTGETLVSVLLR